MNLDKLIKRKKEVLGSSIISETQISPLSKDTDPRVKKLKKELEKLVIKPKPKYIKINFK